MNLWGGAVVELVAVLLGVLIALWVDNWNDARKDRQRELAYLDSLRDDIEADRQALARNVEFAEGTAAAATRLLRLIRNPDEPPPPPNALLRQLKRTGTMYPFRPTNTTLRELSGGGGLSLISDRKLLRGALTYYSTAEMTKELSALAIHHTWYRYYDALVEVVDPVLEPQLSLDAYAQLRSDNGGQMSADSEAPLPDIGVTIAEHAVELEALRGSKRFERVVAQVWDASVVYGESMRDLKAVADDLWQQLDSALGSVQPEREPR